MKDETVATKGEYAKQKGVSATRVGQWLREGKISGEALVGIGRYARIRVNIANEQLRQRLDVTQRLGLNGVATKLDDAPPAIEAHPTAPPPAATHLAAVVAPSQPERPAGEPPPPSGQVVESYEQRLKREKLRQSELATRRAEEDDRVRRGIYVLATESRAALNRQAVNLMKFFDGSLVDIAEAVASEFKIPARGVLHTARGEFRRTRERAAKQLRIQAAAEPEFIDDNDTHELADAPSDKVTQGGLPFGK